MIIKGPWDKLNSAETCSVHSFRGLGSKVRVFGHEWFIQAACGCEEGDCGVLDGREIGLGRKDNGREVTNEESTDEDGAGDKELCGTTHKVVEIERLWGMGRVF